MTSNDRAFEAEQDHFVHGTCECEHCTKVRAQLAAGEKLAKAIEALMANLNSDWSSLGDGEILGDQALAAWNEAQ